MSTRELWVVAGDLDPGRGGQERSVLETLEALADRGVSATVLAPGRDLGLRHRHRTLDPGRGSRTARLRRLLDEAAAALARRPREAMALAYLPVWGCDYYLPRGGIYPQAHRRSAVADRALLPALAARALMPLNRHRRLLRRRERALLSPSNGPTLIALSPLVADAGAAYYALPPSRIRIVQNGIDLARIQEGRRPRREAFGIPDDAVVFLAAARNPRLKGIHQLVSATRHLGDSRPWVLLIAGGRTGAGADPRVRWIGTTDRMADLLHLADVIVHPTFYDPSSRIVLEALAQGVPVITTRWNGAAGFVGGGGIVLEDPRDKDALSSALSAMLDAERRVACRRALVGRGAAVSIQTHVDQLLEVLTDTPRRR